MVTVARKRSHYRGRNRPPESPEHVDRMKLESEVEQIEKELESTTLELAKADLASGLPVSNKKIGEILFAEGLLTADQVERILAEQRRTRHRLFGEIGITLGLIDRKALEKALSAQFGYPCLVTDQDRLHADLVTVQKPFGKEAESFRGLRSQLLMRWFDIQRKPLAIVSTERGEGRSFIAANLAVVLAQLGRRTLLIDADFRNPRQHSLFRVPINQGLSTALSGRTVECLPHQISTIPSLFVISTGPVPPNPQELLSQPAFTFLLQQACEYFENVIVDTPAMSLCADAEIVAARGGSLIVACHGLTKQKKLRELSNRLRDNQAEMVGCVLNEQRERN